MRPEAELFMTVLGVGALLLCLRQLDYFQSEKKWNLKKWELATVEAVGLVTSGNTFSKLPFKVGFHSVL